MDVQEALETLKNINESHELPNDDIIVFLGGFGRELAPVPIVGSFSSGKSSVLNTLLGYSGGRKLLPEDITPETAIPMELQYHADERCRDHVRITFADGTEEFIRLDEYLQGRRSGKYAAGASADTPQGGAAAPKIMRFLLDNTSMSRIPRLLLVDMPGFGSGDGSHDKAIDDYVGRAMAYIVTFPADAMSLTNEVGAALKELFVHGKSICVAITKMDKAPIPENFESARGVLERDLKRFIGDKEIEWVYTNSSSGDTSELYECLQSMNERAGEMLRNQIHLPFLQKQASQTLTYLRGRLNQNGLSESELKENADKMAHDIGEHEAKMRGMTEKFKIAAQTAAEDILGDVRSYLSGRIDSYASLAVSGGSDAENTINTDVRVAVNESAKRRFESIAQKYVEGCSAELKEMEEIQSNMGGFGIAGAGEGEQGDELLNAAAIGVSAGVVVSGGLLASGVALTSVIIGGTLCIPVVGIFVALGAGLASLIFGNKQKEAKRQEMMSEARRKISSEVIPNIINALRPQVAKVISDNTNVLCADMGKRFADLKTANEKTLSDVRDNLNAALGEKAAIAERLAADIKLAESMLANVG
jgi:GTP-binding protein EngB required for normal cell division